MKSNHDKDVDKSFDLYSLNFFENYYFTEREHKQKLYTRLVIFLTALSLIMTCYLKIYTNLPIGGNCILLTFFYTFTFFNIVFLIMIAYFFCRIITMGDYDIPASPKELNEYITGLEKYYIDSGDPDNTENDFKNEIKNQYIKCAENWYHKNIKLAGYTYKATKFLFVLVISTFLTLFFYVANKSFFIDKRAEDEFNTRINRGKNITEESNIIVPPIKIINVIERKGTQMTDKPQQSKQPTSPPTPPPTNSGKFSYSPPTKPSPPKPPATMKINENQEKK